MLTINKEQPFKHAFTLQENVPLADKNWFKTGGAARYYCQPSTAQEFSSALRWAYEQELPLFVLGSGANILISDDGFDGLVIHPALKEISVTKIDSSATVTAGAGVTINDLIDYCLDNQVLGLEEFSGIPGTVGGSVFINLHYYEFLLSQFLVSAQVVHAKTGEVKTVTPEWFSFGYNASTLQTEPYYLLDATFAVKSASELEVAFARGRRQEIIRHRVKRYPSERTCGSFFRNFFEHEVTVESAGKKMIFVAYYLDKIGAKGTLSVGDAVVSHQHANMLVNKGNATSTDIITLARTMQELVHKQFGIIPQPECRLIGFKEHPLLQ